MNDIPLPRAEKININRIRAAIPDPPQYKFSTISPALWILECDDSLVQGSGFDLVGFGTVTNAHVVHQSSNIIAFRANNIIQKYKANIKKINIVLDLAIIEIVDAPYCTYLNPDNEDLDLMSHVAVAGFPNYQSGDTGIFSPGLVVGHRMKSGIRRLLTNAPIVRGMSGGPAVSKGNQVCGVCVTGSDTMRSSADTEEKSIIPISALSLL